MSKMFNPPHPGGILKEDVLPALNLKVTEAAEHALHLERWLPAPTARMWLQMQLEYDLWQVEHSGQIIHIKPARGNNELQLHGSASC